MTNDAYVLVQRLELPLHVICSVRLSTEERFFFWYLGVCCDDVSLAR
jgi:hypothetical protein